MNDKLIRIFTQARDLLAPTDFIGARFTKDTPRGEAEFEILSVKESDDPALISMARVRNLATCRESDTQFPGNGVFSGISLLDTALDDRVHHALAECDRRAALLAQRPAQLRAARERQAAIEALEARAFDADPDNADTRIWCDIILALDVIFEDLERHESRSCGFVAQQIDRAQLFGERIILREKQRSWLRDLGIRAVKRHRALDGGS
ncbi:hypothetical protein NHN26_15905 [Rhodovulum tesquicola]|uniref:hypothetical protein n=1 Tax=Rhodovulum tesquicola TaxID=540254 RepID=UPI0020979086|nr:hypothetical protein [Rhodovulum tesquicola]MCO8146697.1 hypothetical protein [Rhodovulum tesquicola]